MSNNLDCASYFRSRSEYKRCLEELRKKWKSYGRAAGRITLMNASKEECRAIGGIVGRAFEEGSVRFSVPEFEAGLQRTRFAPVELGGVLACYFGEEVLANQEQRRREQEKRADFFRELAELLEGQPGADDSPRLDEGWGITGQSFVSAQGTGRGEKGNAASEWIRAAAETKKYGYQILMKEYAKGAADAKELAETVGRALCVLMAGQVRGEERDGCASDEMIGREYPAVSPDRISGWEHPAVSPDRMSGKKRYVSEWRQPLAVFAAKISGNPHYFDRGTTAGQLLVHGICFYLNRELPGNAREWRGLLLRAGLVPDNVSSSVHAYGLRLRTADGYHPAYEAFCARREPCVVTLENLRGVIEADAVGNCAYVVENEMVFSYLAECLRDKEVTLLCTSGQPRTAALELLSLLAASHTEIYYSGDIDPEGIDIADRLWRRYGDALRIWRMGPSDYEACVSEERVDEVRLAKLSHVLHPVLRETAGCVRKRRCAGYQENLLEKLAGDVRG